MFRSAIALCTLCIALPVQAINTYTIDSAHSYVSTYSPVWKNTGPVTGGGVVTLPGDPVSPQSYGWSLEWQLTPYAISGTFEAEEIYSPINPGITRLQLSNISITSLAPKNAGFSLPIQLSILSGGGLYMSDAACYNDFFYTPLNWSCSGGNIGPIRTDLGALIGNVISLEGGRSGPWLGFNFAVSPTEPAPVTDLSPVAGLFAYSITAATVPEPGTLLLLLSGLSLAAWSRRRRSASQLAKARVTR